MDIVAKVNVDPVLDALTARLQRQVPYALMLALNRTATEIVDATRNRIYARGFRLRTADSYRFIRAAVPYPAGPQLASKTNLRVLVGIEDLIQNLGKSARYAVLPLLEEGGIRVGTRALAGGQLPPSLPVPVRTSPNEVIPKALYPGNLGLQQVRGVGGGLEYQRGGRSSRRRHRNEAGTFSQRAAFRGRRRTFIATSKAGTPLIVQRVGPGPRNTRLLFTMRRTTTVPARHFFYPTARSVINQRVPVNFEGFLALAIRTAR